MTKYEFHKHSPFSLMFLLLLEHGKDDAIAQNNNRARSCIILTEPAAAVNIRMTGSARGKWYRELYYTPKLNSAG